MRKRAVVTGGAGFLGSHLCERLLGEGYEVVGLDNFLTGTPDNVAHLVGHHDFHLVRADVSEYVHVPGAVDFVLHFASPASPIDYLELPIHTLKVGSIGTLHTLGSPRRRGPASSSPRPPRRTAIPLVHPQPESYWGNVNPVGPRGVYDEAKRFAEAMTMAYRRSARHRHAASCGSSTPSARGCARRTDAPSRPSSPRPWPTAPITVHGDGSQSRSICLRRRPGRGHHADAALRPRGSGQPR